MTTANHSTEPQYPNIGDDLESIINSNLTSMGRLVEFAKNPDSSEQFETIMDAVESLASATRSIGSLATSQAAELAIPTPTDAREEIVVSESVQELESQTEPIDQSVEKNEEELSSTWARFKFGDGVHTIDISDSEVQLDGDQIDIPERALPLVPVLLANANKPLARKHFFNTYRTGDGDGARRQSFKKDITELMSNMNKLVPGLLIASGQTAGSRYFFKGEIIESAGLTPSVQKIQPAKPTPSQASRLATKPEGLKLGQGFIEEAILKSDTKKETKILLNDNNTVEINGKLHSITPEEMKILQFVLSSKEEFVHENEVWDKVLSSGQRYSSGRVHLVRNAFTKFTNWVNDEGVMGHFLKVRGSHGNTRIQFLSRHQLPESEGMPGSKDADDNDLNKQALIKGSIKGSPAIPKKKAVISKSDKPRVRGKKLNPGEKTVIVGARMLTLQPPVTALFETYLENKSPVSISHLTKVMQGRPGYDPEHNGYLGRNIRTSIDKANADYLEITGRTLYETQVIDDDLIITLTEHGQLFAAKEYDKSDEEE